MSFSTVMLKRRKEYYCMFIFKFSFCTIFKFIFPLETYNINGHGRRKIVGLA